MPRSGRFVVKPENGVTALRRDERSQEIGSRAGSIAFAIVMMAVGTLAVYFGQIRSVDVHPEWLGLIVALGMLTYFIADVRLRRR